MGIRDIIERKKQQFFIARDSDKLELQKASLAKEREELSKKRAEIQSVRDLQADVRKEQAAIKQLKTQGSRDFANRIFGGLKNLTEGVKKFDSGNSGGFVQNVKALSNDNETYFRSTLEFGNKSPFAGDIGSGKGGPLNAGQEPKAAKAKGKTITIKLND